MAKEWRFRNRWWNPPPPTAGAINFADTISKTKQEFKDECDINRIMQRYRVSGVLPPGMGVGSYGDFSEVGDFLDAQNVIIKAETQFASLPSNVRDRFNNNPAELLAFVMDKKNLDEAKTLGLLKEVKSEAPKAPDNVVDKK